MKFRIVIDFIGAPYMARRQLNDIIRSAWLDVGVHWHNKMRPRHFTAQAFGLYGYRARNRKYWFRKLKKTGQALPLVKSGKSRELAGQAVIRPTTDKVQVAMPAYGLNRRHPHSQIRMADELRTIAPAEYGELEQVMERSLSRKFRSFRNKIRVRIAA